MKRSFSTDCEGAQVLEVVVEFPGLDGNEGGDIFLLVGGLAEGSA